MSWEGVMTEGEFNRKLTAIFSADVKGYSRLMEDDEEATVRTLTEYREVMFKLIHQHNGRVVDSPGDNLLAEFASVLNAVKCAVAIQKELKALNKALPEKRKMHFRIGINLGDVIQDGERIYGDGVNIAARVEGLADPGGICISGTVYEHIKNKLTVWNEYLGEHPVKNISDPVSVYRIRLEGVQPQSVPKAGTQTAPASNRTIVIIVLSALLAGSLLLAGWLAYTMYMSKQETASVAPASPVPGTDPKSMAMKPKPEHGPGPSGRRRMNLKDDGGGSMPGKPTGQSDRNSLHNAERMLRPPTRDGVKQADVILDDLLAADPDNLQALILKGWAGIFAVRFSPPSEKESLLASAKETADKALTLDNRSPEAHSLSANVYLHKRNHEKALEHARKAVELAPDDPDANAYLGMIQTLSGLHDQGSASLQKAIRLSAAPASWHLTRLAEACLFTGDYERGIAAAKKVLRRQPQNIGALISMTANLIQIGRDDKAKKTAGLIMRARPGFNVSQIGKITPYKKEEDLQLLTSALKKAGL